MIVTTITDKTTEYLSVPAVVGHESAFISYLKKDFKALGLTVKKSGGLIAVHGSKPQSHIISAHLDRHGLISIGGGEYFYAAQYIKEIKYGESNINATQILKDAADRFIGENVFAYDSKSGKALAHGTISQRSPTKEKGDGIFYVHNMLDMPLDTPVAYVQTPEATNTHYAGQIDNTLSLAVVYALYKNGYQGTALLTVEEEIGKSWLHISRYFKANKIETDRLIVLDTSPYKDADSDIIDNGTITLRNRDKSECFNADLIGELKAICDDMGLAYHMKDEFLIAKGAATENLGSTELGKLVMFTKGRWNGATLQIPTTSYHTSHERTSLKAIENYYAILAAILMGQ